ncbi:hypothetical protein JAAARDRAFT_194846 [Jaapia argillacea MUCL 33604]|uniref:F-box domain-containing protein n=1 Tax=Jaapia argillacea MUCL 33604 TaxID=933084 RepID=A0A067Q068_9AGAM|nr:hypothetical protein JAAARDRAFT_194846 [Jaapia argillacea MUCL 33604]
MDVLPAGMQMAPSVVVGEPPSNRVNMDRLSSLSRELDALLPEIFGGLVTPLIEVPESELDSDEHLRALDVALPSLYNISTAASSLTYKMDQFTSQICEAVAELDRRRLAIIRRRGLCRLPNEIMGHILVLAGLPSKDQMEQVRKGVVVDFPRFYWPIRASHINSHFRHIALTTPALWSYLFTPRGPKSSMDMNLVKLYLNRCKAHPLDITVRCPHTPRWRGTCPTYYTELFGLLWPLSSQIRNLTLLTESSTPCEEATLPLAYLFTAEMPLLQSVVFHSLPTSLELDGKALGRPMFAGGAPQLESLTVTMYPFADFSHLTNLRHIDIQLLNQELVGAPMMSRLLALVALPNLAKLSVTIGLLVPTATLALPERDVIQVEKLERLSIISQISGIAISDTMTYLLSHISLGPSLRHLYIATHGTTPQPLIAALLSPRNVLHEVESFHFGGPGATHPLIPEVLKRMSSLRRLSLGGDIDPLTLHEIANGVPHLCGLRFSNIFILDMFDQIRGIVAARRAIAGMLAEIGVLDIRAKETGISSKGNRAEAIELLQILRGLVDDFRTDGWVHFPGDNPWAPSYSSSALITETGN